jgi:hypothetical protein
METIQCMEPNGSPLALLAQQGAEAMNLIVAEKSASGLRRGPSAGSNDRASHTRSEAASSASPNQHLAENNARWRIMQNHSAREYGYNWDDLRNVIEDRSAIGIEQQVHHNDSQQGTSLQQGGVVSVLWRGHLGKSGGRPNSKQATLINTTAPAILKNLFRFIKPS